MYRLNSSANHSKRWRLVCVCVCIHSFTSSFVSNALIFVVFIVRISVNFQFFQIPCPHAYDLLDKCHMKLHYLEKQQRALVDSASIFGLTLPSEQELTKCRIDIKLAKVIADHSQYSLNFDFKFHFICEIETATVGFCDGNWIVCWQLEENGMETTGCRGNWTAMQEI